MYVEVKKKKKKKRKKPAVRVAVIGTFMRTKKGSGFVVTEKKGASDIFIPKGKAQGAMHGDTVEVKVAQGALRGASPIGRVMKILNRSAADVVGTFETNENFGFVVPDNHKICEDIFISEKNFGGARKGDKVVAMILKYPSEGNDAEGKVIEIICGRDDSAKEVKSLIRQYNLTEEFPEKVEEDSALIAESGFDADGRTDLRDKVIFTIDGADSKDLDDAVSVEKNEKGNYVLGVHIADVSSYVVEDGATDREAQKRGNSVYLIDQVIPMLPKVLSNGICSLNKGEDRLTLSIDMEINGEGDIVAHHVYESVIRSRERMVYTDVSDMLEKNDADLIKKYGSIYGQLLFMKELAEILQNKRGGRGNIDFGIEEAHIELDENGAVKSVTAAERRTANRMIEEFMIAANETIAEHFCLANVPFVYRVHQKPDVKELEKFKAFIGNFGLSLKDNGGKIESRFFSELLSRVSGEPYAGVVNTVMLRSMKKAVYSTECEGHFGLGSKYYCHFTSPIRRYPDLIIHRIIKELLTGHIEKKRRKVLKKKTEDAAEISSFTERKASELEREVEKTKKAEYIARHIGEVFEGVISGVTAYGVYAQLPNTIEGLIHIDSLADDYYDYDPQKYRLIGQARNKVFALGDKIKIVVKSADPAERRVDFELCRD